MILRTILAHLGSSRHIRWVYCSYNVGCPLDKQLLYIALPKNYRYSCPNPRFKKLKMATLFSEQGRSRDRPALSIAGPVEHAHIADLMFVYY